MIRRPPRSTLFPYNDALPILWRSRGPIRYFEIPDLRCRVCPISKFPRSSFLQPLQSLDRKSTRLNSSHSQISYAVFCLKKKNTRTRQRRFGDPLTSTNNSKTV